MITQIRKYPTRCKNEDKNVAINMVHTAKKRKHTHIEKVCIYEIVRVLYGKIIDVILTAENQSYVGIKKRTVNAPCSS